MDRVRLCETPYKSLCDEFGVEEVQEALSDVIDAIQEETNEIDFDAPGGEDLEERLLCWATDH